MVKQRRRNGFTLIELNVFLLKPQLLTGAVGPARHPWDNAAHARIV